MINYKLAKEIGATHHIDRLLYKFNDDGFAMCYFTEHGWEKTENDAAHMAALGKISFDKVESRTRTEYEKVTESIFDLRDEFERGELYFQQGGEYLSYKLEAEFAHGFMHDRIYRKVEKEIDWREEVSAWVQENQSVNIDFLTNSVMYYHGSVSNDTFLEMCRVALRANGEIE